MDMVQIELGDPDEYDKPIHPLNKDDKLNFKIQRNNDKKSKTDYLCINPLFSQFQQLNEGIDENAEVIAQRYKNIGLEPLSVKFDRNCYAVQLVKNQALPWILRKFWERTETFARKKDDELLSIGQEDGPPNDLFFSLFIPSLFTNDCPAIDVLRHLVLSQHLLAILRHHNSIKELPGLCGCKISISDLISMCTSSTLPSSVTDDSKFINSLSTFHFVDQLGDAEWLIQFSNPPTIHGNTLTQWKLVKGSPIFICLNVILSSLHSNKRTVLYHVISASQSYQHQVMLSILNQIIIHQSQGEVTHHTIEVGTVKLSSLDTSMKEYIESRRMYLVRSSQEKFGEIDVDGGGFWRRRINDLTLTSIKFELLSRSPKQTVSIATADGGSCDVKVGSFVMYNCSRIATLLDNFHKQVEQGVYPALCSFEEANLSLLKTQDEWLLVFHYINVYPLLTLELVNSISQGQITTTSNQLSRIVKFLHNLSRDFSTYYSRTHILGEARPHLMPLMMARLWLVKLVYRVLVDGLSLLGIAPYDSM